MVRFVSTRAHTATKPRIYSFSEAVLAGWADDGGMLLPETVPRVSASTLQAWAGLSYPQLCLEVFKCFVDDDDVPHADLERLLLHTAFTRFGNQQVVAVEPVAVPAAAPGGPSSTLHMAELWHGPTLAFKDLGMAVLGALLQYLLQRSRTHLTLLVGTSGDTGSAAIEAVKGLPEVDIVVLYPQREYANVTLVQERQMTALDTEPNVDVVSVQGTSDDLDVPMEVLFRDPAFKRRHRLGTLNSVNVARVLTQVVHYFYSHLRVQGGAKEPVAFYVPTGAAGHLSAGCLALQMGLPGVVQACTNENDVLHRFVQSGVLRRSAAVVRTNTPSMDIQVPYNVERLMFMLTGGDSQQVCAWMEEFKQRGELQLSGGDMDRLRALGVRSAAVASAEVLQTMRGLWEHSRYLLDPHTAVGVAAARRHLASLPHRCCMACAHPAKFPETVAEALSCSLQAARHLIPDQEHACVGPALKLLDMDKPPVVKSLRIGEDWTAKLRALVETKTALREAGWRLPSRL